MKNATLAAAALLAVALAVGFAYAHWSETLLIAGTVNTGELDWQFTQVQSLDPGTTLDYHCNDGFEGQLYWQGEKHVGTTTIEITEDPHVAQVTLTNVYPSYFTSITLYAQNTGTIPLIIDKVIIDGIVISAGTQTIVSLDLDDDGQDDIEIWWKDGIGTQLEPDDFADEMSIWIHILQPAPEGATLTFQIQVVAIQWNLYGA
jgi:hypothetical protein